MLYMSDGAHQRNFRKTLEILLDVYHKREIASYSQRTALTHKERAVIYAQCAI